MRSRYSKTSIGFLISAAAVPIVAHSAVYLTEDQATAAMFPGEKFTRKAVDLTPADVKKIEDLSGETVHHPAIVAYVGSKKNIVLVDQVLGKHEFITFAVGLTPGKGTVQDVEILEYRETYGYQVREPAWRKQFVGKDATAPIKVGKDITNISGATLSSAHVTNGVRRLLETYGVVRDRL